MGYTKLSIWPVSVEPLQNWYSPATLGLTITCSKIFGTDSKIIATLCREKELKIVQFCPSLDFMFFAPIAARKWIMVSITYSSFVDPACSCCCKVRQSLPKLTHVRTGRYMCLCTYGRTYIRTMLYTCTGILEWAHTWPCYAYISGTQCLFSLIFDSVLGSTVILKPDLILNENRVCWPKI